MAMIGAKRLRELMKREDNIVVAPGVYDGLSARLALAAGAECLYMVSLTKEYTYISRTAKSLD